MADLSRRLLLGVGSALTLAPSIGRAVSTGKGDEIIALWPDKAPGDTGARIVRKVDDRSHDAGHPDRWITGVARPTLTVRRP
ncbi:MAG TPA: alpha/beta hydrolase, partial [Sphingomonas sp.]|nr:alpha/beta hydrolase [Sphingomonas sp.]